MEREKLIQCVKQAVHNHEPTAEIVLYGSRSRGDAQEGSDWDFLILIDRPGDDEQKDRIRHALYEIEWECDEIISSLICLREDWHSSRYQALPLHKAVTQEGVIV